MKAIKVFFAGLGTAALLGIGGFLFVTLAMPLLFPGKGPSEVSVPAVAAPDVKRAPTELVNIRKPVKVFTTKTKTKLKLPDAVVKNPEAHVLSATQVPGSLRPQTITTVLDEKTGESRSFVKADPYPWLAIENRGEVRMAYGYRYSGLGQPVKAVGRLSFAYDALRVKALTIGPSGTVDTDGQAFIGVGVSYKW